MLFFFLFLESFPSTINNQINKQQQGKSSRLIKVVEITGRARGY